MQTTKTSDRKRIAKALDGMTERTGVVWRGGRWTCCGTCGHYDLRVELGKEASYVFWHVQSDEGAFGEEITDVVTYSGYDEEELSTEGFAEVGDELLHNLYIYHSDNHAASEAVKALRGAGFEVEWDGSETTAVRVVR